MYMSLYILYKIVLYFYDIIVYISDLSFMFARCFSCIQGNGCLHCEHTYFYTEVLVHVGKILFDFSVYVQLIQTSSCFDCMLHNDTSVKFLTCEFPSVVLLLQMVCYKIMFILRRTVCIMYPLKCLLLFGGFIFESQN